MNLSAKYINERYLPDKAIDVIDEAGVLLRLSRIANTGKRVQPSDIEKVVSKIARIPTQSVSTSDQVQSGTSGREVEGKDIRPG